MFGFLRKGLRPFASIGEKIGEILSIGRKSKPMGAFVEPVIESRPIAKSFAETFDPSKNISAGYVREFGGKLRPTADDLYLMPSAIYDSSTKGFYGVGGEGY